MMTGKMNSTYFSMKHLRKLPVLHILCGLPASLLLFSSPAHAVQTHGGAEGLISHELGHILFITGMLILLYRVHKARLTKPGWQEFRVFLWLILLWNMLTFCSHWMREVVTAEHFIRQGGRLLSFRADTFFDLVFYATRLDHLLLVPAIFMLLLATRKWGQNK